MMKKTFFALAFSALLAACGGGGSSSPPAAPSSAQGLWVGTTTTNRTATALVLSDGSYYVLYSAVNNPAVIGGVVQGSSTATAGALASGDAKDFNLEGAGVVPATLAGTYTTKQSLGATVTYPAGAPTTFTSTYDPSYETVPTLATIAGTYSGTVAFSLGSQAASVTVSTGGEVTGSANGCSLAGLAKPRADANAYDVSITFGPAPCYFAGQTFAGIGYFNATTKRLYAAAPNAARTDGVLFVGTKP